MNRVLTLASEIHTSMENSEDPNLGPLSALVAIAVFHSGKGYNPDSYKAVITQNLKDFEQFMEKVKE